MLLFLLWPFWAAAEEETHFTLTAIAANTWVHFGQHRHISEQGRDDIANLAVIAGDRCLAVLDSGGSLRIGKAFYRAIRKYSKKPICYLINSHFHYDHLLGNAAFAAENPQIIAHYQGQSHWEENRRFFLSNFAAETKAEKGPSLLSPNRWIKQNISLDLGGRKLELRPHRTAHSRSDLSVFDPNSGIVFTGDLVFSEHIPILDGHLRGWLAVLEELKSTPARRMLPGHGSRLLPWPQGLQDSRRYLTNLLKETKQAIDSGSFFEDSVQHIGQQESARWTFFSNYHKRNINRAYQELEWE